MEFLHFMLKKSQLKVTVGFQLISTSHFIVGVPSIKPLPGLVVGCRYALAAINLNKINTDLPGVADTEARKSAFAAVWSS